MKLTGWLFEIEEQVLSTEEQLGILSDYITGDLSSIFPNAKLEEQTDRSVLWNLLDLKNNSKLKLFYAYKEKTINGKLISHLPHKIVCYIENSERKEQITSAEVKEKNYQKYKQKLVEFFLETATKLEKYSEFETTIPKIVQEIVDYFDAGPPVELTRIGKPQSNKINFMFDQNPDNIVQIEVENIQTQIFLWFRIVQDAEINTISGFSINLEDSFEDKFEIKWNEIRTRLIDWIAG